MLEQIIIRKPFLKKHLAAPLLKERESFLTMKSKEGLSRLTLLGWAGYSLKFIQYFDLHDGKKRIVSLDDIVEAARLWSSPISGHYHSRKHHDCPSSRIKFIEMAVDFLQYVGLLDFRYQDEMVNYLAERKWHKVRLIAAPFYNERMSFLMDCKSKGFKRKTLQLYAQYQLHIIEYLNLENFRTVTNEEISNAAKKWQNLEDKGSHKKKGTKSNYSFFTYFANMWLKELHMLPESESPSISEMRINEYLNHLAYRRYSHAYIKGRKDILTYFYKIIEKENQTYPLTMEDIDKYIEYYTVNKVQRNTLKEYLCCIRVYLRYAVEKGWCIADLDKALITPKVYSEENLPSFLPWNKVQKLLQTVKEQTGKSASRDYAIFMLLAMYGLRCSEVANLKVSDINWRKEQIYIKHAKNCRPQVLPLLHNVGEAIIAYLKQGRPNDIGSDNLFFCTPAPIRSISCTAIASVVYRYLKSSEMEVRHKGPHCLRHSHATFLINKGQTLKDVGDLLGHKSMEATIVYAKVDLNSLRDVSNINWGGASMSIKETVESFIKFRTSIGRKDQSTTYSLRLFAKFIGETTELTSITESDSNAFLYRKGNVITRYWHSQHCILKKLFEWAFSRGLIQNIPVPVFLPKAPEYYPAYIYTDDELKRLFDCALTYRKYRPLVNEPICIRYILMITYVLGLRISETLSLKIEDIDMDDMYVHIHCSKFYKSRLVTFNEQVSRLIQEILQWRSTQMYYPMEEESYVFINLKGKPVNLVSLHQIFATIRKNAGLYFPDRGRHQPKIHDLRHTFAVNVLTNWYKSGKNVQDLLPKLSTYLGHLNVSFTSVYLTKTPTLLQEANKLFYAYKNTNNEK